MKGVIRNFAMLRFADDIAFLGSNKKELEDANRRNENENKLE